MKKDHVFNRCLLSCFVLALLVSSSTLIDSVSAASYTENFDTDIAGQAASEGSWFQSSKFDIPARGDFFVSGAQKRSGVNSFLSSNVAGQYSFGYFNYSLSNTITSISFYLLCSGVGGNVGSLGITLRNGSGDAMQDFGLYGYLAGYWKVETGLNVYQFAFNTWNRIVISFPAFNTVNFSMYNETGVLQDWELASLTDTAYNFSTLYFTAGQNSGNWYIDDMVVTTGDIEGRGCSLSGSLDNYIGTLVNDRYQQVNDMTIETLYNVERNCSFIGLDLNMGSDTYSDDSDLSHYYLFVNGDSAGNPVCVYDGFDSKIMRWDLDGFSVENEVILLEWQHTQDTASGRYWQIGTGAYSDRDLDSDGYVRFKQTEQIPDGVFSGTTKNYDISYRLYIQNDTEVVLNPDYSDSIDIYNYLGIHEDYDIPYYRQYTNVFGAYTLSTLYPLSTLHVEYEGAELFEQNYPRPLYSYLGSIGYVPQQIGNYTLNISRGGVSVASVDFYVVNNSNWRNYVFTVPNPSIKTDPIEVTYYWNNERDGALGIFQETADINDGADGALYWRTITENGTASFSYFPSDNRPLYLQLFVEYQEDTYTTIGDLYTHYIIDDSQGVFIRVGDDILYRDYEEESVIQEIRYQHYFLGVDVVVRMNGNIIADVSNALSGKLFYYATEYGSYTVTLDVFINGSFVTIASDTFVVVEGTGYDPGPVDFIPVEYHVYIAFGIILGFILMPFIVVSRVVAGIQKTKGVTIKIPENVFTISSTISGVTGYVLTIYLQLLEWWTVFVLIFILTLVIAAMYLMKRGGGDQ